MSQPIPEPDVDPRVGGAWRDHRRYVLDIALRMLGDLGDAEDVVQEAFSRLWRTRVDEIDDVRGWLVTVVSRLCLDQLRSARRTRQRPLDDPDRLVSTSASTPAVIDPADRVTLDDTVRLALHVVLERLSPAERTAFVLHDVFQVAFDDIAAIVGRSPAACRQLASRARRHLVDEGQPARFTIESAEQRTTVERFMHACSTGDLPGLLAVLDPEVSGDADFGDARPAPRPLRLPVGRDAVARGLLRFLGPRSDTTLLSLPAGRDPVVVAIRDDEVVALATLTVRDTGIHHIHGVVDPVRLASLSAVLQGASVPGT